MSDWRTEYIEEPELQFADGESKDPRVGLVKHGPRTPANEDSHKIIKLGVVGSSQSISLLERLFDEMRNGITRDSDEPKRWKPPFPGLGRDSPFKFSLDIQKRWRELITRGEISKITDVKDSEKRYEMALRYISQKIELIYNRESPPDVIVVALPEEIKEACTPSNQLGGKLQGSQSDFRSRIKLTGMECKIPTQLIRPKTLREEGDVEEKADIAWNLAVALLYKARRGHPWKLAHLEQDTCYAGISFYQERADQSNTKASMAQVFLETGESFILRGDPVVEERGSGRGNNHLSEEDAESLVQDILDQYELIKHTRPERLVLHKTSKYFEEEKSGFLSAANDAGVRKLDFVTIYEDSPLNLFTEGDYPVLRGTLAVPPEEEEFHLYSKGYIPSLSTYPGLRIPNPIRVRPDPDVNDTPYRELCEEILAFTKMDWNTSSFCKKLPVTIEVSRAVGRILAESKARDLKIDPHYYFYM